MEQIKESTQDSQTKITAPGSKDLTWQEDRDCSLHGSTLHRIMSTPFGSEIRNCLLCAEANEESERKHKEREERIKKGEAQRDINQRLANSLLTPRFINKTLASYKVKNKGQQGAVKACRAFLESMNGSMGLLFIGKSGTGKNHLACAIAHEAIEKYGKTALVTKVRKVDRAIRETWKRDSLESDVIKSFVTPDLLIIDEIGLQRGSETEMLHIAEIIDDRYESMKPTILMGNVEMDEMRALIGERAVERFKEGGTVITFDWESYRGKS